MASSTLIPVGVKVMYYRPMDGFNSTQLPLGAGSVFGFRSWNPYHMGMGIYLQGAYYTVWYPPFFRSYYRAHCLPKGSHQKWGWAWDLLQPGHSVPQRGCQCGFYAFWRIGHHPVYHGPVAGVVEGFGKVIIGTKGFRASRCRIKALSIADPMIAFSLWEVYHVPVYGDISEMLSDHPLTTDYVK